MNSERVPSRFSAARTRTASHELIDHSEKMRISGKPHATAQKLPFLGGAIRYQRSAIS